jgi:hypothetical protein
MGNELQIIVTAAMATPSPLPDLDGEVFAEFVQAVLQTAKDRPRINADKHG